MNFPVQSMSVLWISCTTRGAEIGEILWLVSFIGRAVVARSMLEATFGDPRGTALFPYSSEAGIGAVGIGGH